MGKEHIPLLTCVNIQHTSPVSVSCARDMVRSQAKSGPQMMWTVCSKSSRVFCLYLPCGRDVMKIRQRPHLMLSRKGVVEDRSLSRIVANLTELILPRYMSVKIHSFFFT